MAKFSPFREEMRRAWRTLRGEDLSPARGALAVGIGLFIGCQPIFGLHLPLVLLVCLRLRLDAAIAYLAANVSNPFFAPALITAEVQAGAFVTTGSLVRIDQDARDLGVSELLSRYARFILYGAPSLGLALALAGAAGTYGVLSIRRRLAPGSGRHEPYRLPDDAPPWVHAADRVAARFADARSPSPGDRARYHYVRIKLATDPVARLVADVEGEAPGALGDVVDIGTGRGQLPLLLLELGRATRVRGLDWDEGKIAAARRAAESLEATFDVADAREAELDPADTVLLIDVLHYFEPAEQDAILDRAAAAVRPGGRVIVREADPRRGWRSTMTRIEESVFTLARFNRGDRVAFRAIDEIVARLESHGLSCEVLPAWGGTPFSNVLVVGRASSTGG